jgi:hypothetical protein
MTATKMRTRFAAKLVFCALVLMSPAFLYGQQGTCRMQWGAINGQRAVQGTVHTECSFVNGPWGNWGVTSNVGWASDGDQFMGWKRLDRHYQWNSCTNYPKYPPGNCNYYNSESCTEQVTWQGNGVHGGGWDYVFVSCPVDYDGDGACDAGGCLDASSYTLSNNWMSLYELDHAAGDDFVTTLYFPDTTAYLNCTVWGCYNNAAEWVSPWYSTNPSTGVTAQLTVAVINISFVDIFGQCAALAQSHPEYNCY